MKKVIGALLALAGLAALPAQAQVVCTGGDTVAATSARVCWTNATTDTAGVELPATGVGSLKLTRLQHIRMASIAADCDFAAPAEPIETKEFAPTVGGFLYENLLNGRHCFRARHVNNEGLLSDWSPVAYKNIAAPKPPGKPRPPSLSVDQTPTFVNPAASEDEEFE